MYTEVVYRMCCVLSYCRECNYKYVQMAWQLSFQTPLLVLPGKQSVDPLPGKAKLGAGPGDGPI